jgi:DNA-binding transcriptional regulator YiaG
MGEMIEVARSSVQTCLRVAQKLRAEFPQKTAKKWAGQEPTTLGEHIKKRRLDSGLFQRDLASRLKVTVETIVNWERDHQTPPIRMWPKIIAFLGYDPHPEPRSLSERIEAQRRRLGWTYPKTAGTLGVSVGTVIRWIKGTNKRNFRQDKLDQFLAVQAPGRTPSK